MEDNEINELADKLLNFPKGRTLLLLTKDNVQVARFTDENGFPKEYILEYRSEEEILPDGEHSSDLFEYSPPIAAGFVGNDGKLPRMESKNYISIRKID